MTRIAAAPEPLRISESREGVTTQLTRDDPAQTVKWIFELQPAHELPAVDLSMSIKSRFLGPRMLAALSVMVSFRRTLFVSAVFAFFSYPIALVIDTRYGRPLAAASTIAGIPVALAGFSILRYDVVKLLMATYDTVFFLGITAITLGSFAVLLHDARTGTIIATFVGLLPNIFIDANLRAVRRLTVLTAMHVISMILATSVLVLDVVPEGNGDMILLSYGSHVLPAKMVVSNGMATLIVLLLRNSFRKRDAIFHRGNPALQHCVTYRATLKLTLVQARTSARLSSILCSVAESLHAAQQNAPVQETLATSIPENRRRSRPFSSTASVATGEESLDHIQQLRYHWSHQAIDARRTVAHQAFYLLLLPTNEDNERMLKRILAIGRFLPFIVTVVAYPLDLWLIPMVWGENAAITPISQIAALALTGSYFISIVLLCQRNLLKTLVTSFDFVYLSVHIILLGVCLCDFFRWNRHSLLVLVVSIWMHIFMIIDALTPPIRERLGVHIHGIAVRIAVIAFGSLGFVMYVLIFDPSSSVTVYDRVLWSGQVGGTQRVELTLLPFFYSGLFTAIVLIIRMLFKAAVAANDELIFIEGHVVFTNCFQRKKDIDAQRSATRKSSKPIRGDRQLECMRGLEQHTQDELQARILPEPQSQR